MKARGRILIGTSECDLLHDQIGTGCGGGNNNIDCLEEDDDEDEDAADPLPKEEASSFSKRSHRCCMDIMMKETYHN